MLHLFAFLLMPVACVLGVPRSIENSRAQGKNAPAANHVYKKDKGVRSMVIQSDGSISFAEQPAESFLAPMNIVGEVLSDQCDEDYMKAVNMHQKLLGEDYIGMEEARADGPGDVCGVTKERSRENRDKCKADGGVPGEKEWEEFEKKYVTPWAEETLDNQKREAEGLSENTEDKEAAMHFLATYCCNLEKPSKVAGSMEDSLFCCM